jgi:hypothetical protein
MQSLFKDLFSLFNFFQELLVGVQKLITPPKAYSWQTFIYLSLFSWALSYFATGLVKDIIAFGGWIFLIAGTSWYTTDDPARVPGTFMPVGALITGFLVSVFAFGHQVNVVTPKTIVIWPTLAAVITAVPSFFEGNGTTTTAKLPKVQERQKIIVLLAWCMLLSCWLQFYFVIDKWVKEYPSLLTENFQKSAFVIGIEPNNKQPKNGSLILNKIQPLIESQIENKPWSEVEKWLLKSNERLDNISQDVLIEKLAKVKEQELWRVEPRVVNVKSGYRLDILTIWNGPSADPRGYYLKKSCTIKPVGDTTKPDVKNAKAEISCDKTKLMKGAPPPQQ